MGRRSFGYVRKMPSGRWQASYVHPPSVGKRHTAPRSFHTKGDANEWLNNEATLIAKGTWEPPRVRAERAAADAVEQQVLTFGAFALSYLEGRHDLRATTRASYTTALHKHLIPTFGPMALDEVDGPAVRAWFASYGRKTPTARAHAYALLKQIMDAAVEDELLPRNPCRIKAGARAKTKREPEVLTLDELLRLADAMPAKFRALALLSGFCGLRFGEAVALRRRDVDLKNKTVVVTRTFIRADHAKATNEPKTNAGRRTVAMPDIVVDALRQHLKDVGIAGGRDALVFPGANGELLAPSALYGRSPRIERRGTKRYRKSGYGFYAAREEIGRPSLHWHDLRRTAATLGAQNGATVKEMQARLGHSTPAMALHYQGASAERDRALADRIQAQVDDVRHGR